MDKNQSQKQNSLLIYRRRMGFSQKRVAHLLGFGDTAMVSRYEHGRCMPPLPVAFGLGIILRVPVEFLFPDLYDSMRKTIRAAEDRMHLPIRQTLFPGQH